MSLPAPKAVIFDWDNTLVNTWPVIHEAMTATFLAMGHVPWTLEETKARVRKSMRDAFPALFGDDWEKAGEIYQQHYRAHSICQNWKPLPLAEEVLEQVKELGLLSASSSAIKKARTCARKSSISAGKNISTPSSAPMMPLATSRMPIPRIWRLKKATLGQVPTYGLSVIAKSIWNARSIPAARRFYTASRRRTIRNIPPRITRGFLITRMCMVTIRWRCLLLIERGSLTRLEKVSVF